MTDDNDWENAPGMVTREMSILKAKEDRYSFGNLLRTLGYISQTQLDEALAYQRSHPREKLGEILISLGYIDAEKLQEATSKQKALRGGGQSRRRVIYESGEEATKASRSLSDTVSDLTQLAKDALRKLTE